MPVNKLRIRKSVKLTPAEMKAFKKWVKDQPTRLDAKEELGVSYPTLDRILLTGGGHQTTVEKIRKVIPQEA